MSHGRALPSAWPSVINAAGKMTALGGSALAPAVAQAMAAAGEDPVELAALRELAGTKIAQWCGAAAATVTSGAAAGIAIATAATITGSDQALIHQLPSPVNRPRRILLQAGHQVDFGAPVEQMIRIGGGEPVLVGSVNRVSEQDLNGALQQPAAALLYVQSHHCVQNNQLPLETCVNLARQYGVPVIVDAAAEEDLEPWAQSGAALVTASGGKALGGPTCGLIAGDADLIAACELQYAGIARPMKVGKEQIAGLLAALELYSTDGSLARMRAERLQTALAGIPADVSLKPDEAGRALVRTAVRTDRARDLAAFLRASTPPIFTRNHQLDSGWVLFDPRELRDRDLQPIAQRVREFFESQ